MVQKTQWLMRSTSVKRRRKQQRTIDTYEVKASEVEHVQPSQSALPYVQQNVQRSNYEQAARNERNGFQTANGAFDPSAYGLWSPPSWGALTKTYSSSLLFSPLPWGQTCQTSSLRANGYCAKNTATLAKFENQSTVKAVTARCRQVQRGGIQEVTLACLRCRAVSCVHLNSCSLPVPASQPDSTPSADISSVRRYYQGQDNVHWNCHCHSMQSAPIALVLLLFWSSIADAVTPSATLACDRVSLASQSSTKWTVRCATANTASASVAYFDPSLVQNFFVNSGAYVAASAANLNLSSTFSEVDVLVSSSVKKFSLSASGFTPTIPVTIVPTAFSKLTALQTLYLEGIPLADSDLHLVLPPSIRQISIVDCGLRKVSFEFADGSAIADSSLSYIDLHLNALTKVPTSLYSLPKTVSTINLLGNDQLSFSTETSAHMKQLSIWLDDEILLVDKTAISSLDSSSLPGQTPVVEATQAGSSKTAVAPDNVVSNSSSGSDKSVTSTQENSDKSTVPITIVAMAVPTLVLVGIAITFIMRKGKKIQKRETDGILDLPHPFDKNARDRSETSGNFTTVDTELSRSRMSTGDVNYHDAIDRDSFVMLAVTPTDSDDEATDQLDTTTPGYVNLKSPQSRFSLTNTTRSVLNRDNGDSSHSLELLGALSAASTTPAQTRLATRNTLRSALEAIVAAKLNAEGVLTPALLNVNAHQYSFSPGTKVGETALAFFIDCRLLSTKKSSSEPAASTNVVLKIFIEDDADLAGRESYALTCLQQDDSTRVFAPRIHDTALEYELVAGDPKINAVVVKLNCCILVLEMPSCALLRTHVATSQELPPQLISRVVNAVDALHSRGLVHGALHAGSLVACSPDGRVKFWGLEHASRSGHMVPTPDPDLIGVCQAEYVAPELASVVLEETPSIRASSSLDVWSLGVIVLKMYAADRSLEEFQGCTTPHAVFVRLTASDHEENACFFERSIDQFVQDDEMKDLLHQCLQQIPTSRPSFDEVLKHNVFGTKERGISRPTTAKNAAVIRMLSAIIEEREATISSEPEREESSKEPLPEKKEQEVDEAVDDFVPEPLPPTLWLFLPPVELEIDLTERASYFSEEQWVSSLVRLQQQQSGELRFPLVFMCESCGSNATVPCSIATNARDGTTVTDSLLPLVMPLVRETMLFLEARAILSNGLSVGEANGLAGPQQWEELRTFYRALERMELATLNPVNELELAPHEQQLKTRDPSKAQQVLDELTHLIFCEEKREYVRNLLDALISDDDLVARAERSSWAALRRCDVNSTSSSTLNRTRWLCSQHAPQDS